MAGGVFDADFAGTVKRGAFGKIDIGGLRAGFERVKILDFDVEECWAFADSAETEGKSLSALSKVWYMTSTLPRWRMTKARRLPSGTSTVFRKPRCSVQNGRTSSIFSTRGRE